MIGDAMMGPMGARMPGMPEAPRLGSTGPAAVPAPDAGMGNRAKIMADLAVKALMQALQLAGPDTEEGQALLKGIQAVTKAYPAPPSDDLSQQEVKLLSARANPTPGAPPQEGASALLQRLGIGGAAQAA